MIKTIGILIFDGAEELDFVGPYEVFTMAEKVRQELGSAVPEFETLLISQDGGSVACAKGMTVEAHRSAAQISKLDVLLVPGGQGTRREVDNRALLDWVAKISQTCEWTTSVCTGSFILSAAGVAKDKRVTTHWASIERLRQSGHTGEVMENIRYVRDGTVVTAAGVSAGIDMALWLVGQIAGPAHARATQRGMEYDPAPPYTAEV